MFYSIDTGFQCCFGHLLFTIISPVLFRTHHVSCDKWVHALFFLHQFPMGPGSDGPLGAMAGMEPHHMNGSLGNTTHYTALNNTTQIYLCCILTHSLIVYSCSCYLDGGQQISLKKQTKSFLWSQNTNMSCFFLYCLILRLWWYGWDEQGRYR